jgi:hypothetical protein
MSIRLAAGDDCPRVVMAPSGNDAKLSLRLRMSSHAQPETSAFPFDNPSPAGPCSQYNRQGFVADISIIKVDLWILTAKSVCI